MRTTIFIITEHRQSFEEAFKKLKDDSKEIFSFEYTGEVENFTRVDIFHGETDLLWYWAVTYAMSSYDKILKQV